MMRTLWRDTCCANICSSISFVLVFFSAFVLCSCLRLQSSLCTWACGGRRTNKVYSLACCIIHEPVQTSGRFRWRNASTSRRGMGQKQQQLPLNRHLAPQNITIDPSQSVASCQDFVFQATDRCCRSLHSNSKCGFIGRHKTLQWVSSVPPRRQLVWSGCVFLGLCFFVVFFLSPPRWWKFPSVAFDLRKTNEPRITWHSSSSTLGSWGEKKEREKLKKR